MIVIVPLAGYVLVKPEVTKEIGEFKLAPDKNESYMNGLVLSCGSATRKLKCPVYKGDMIIFKKYSGHKIDSEGEELQLVEFEHIIARIDNVNDKNDL